MRHEAELEDPLAFRPGRRRSTFGRATGGQGLPAPRPRSRLSAACRVALASSTLARLEVARRERPCPSRLLRAAWLRPGSACPDGCSARRARRWRLGQKGARAILRPRSTCRPTIPLRDRAGRPLCSCPRLGRSESALTSHKPTNGGRDRRRAVQPRPEAAPPSGLRSSRTEPVASSLAPASRRVRVVRYVLLRPRLGRRRVRVSFPSMTSGPLPPGDVVALSANPTVVHRLTGADPERVRAVARTAVHGGGAAGGLSELARAVRPTLAGGRLYLGR